MKENVYSVEEASSLYSFCGVHPRHYRHCLEARQVPISISVRLSACPPPSISVNMIRDSIKAQFTK